MRTMDLHCIAALCLALPTGIAAKAQAADTVTVPAVQTAYIRSDGPVKGSNAERYLDVEGKSTGKYACYGVVRFDGKSLKSSLDARYGAGKARITGLTLELTQSNARFTKNGSVVIYLSQAVSVDVSMLKYPYDPKAGSTHGEPIATVRFIQSAEAGGKEAGAVKGKGNTTAPNQSKQAGGEEKPDASAPGKTDMYDLMKGAKGHTLANILAQGKAVTLILVEGEPTVAATWAGQKPDGTHKPPILIVKLTAK